jgi:hypothetical protein
LSTSKGELISNNNHRRDTSTKLDVIQHELLVRFSGAEEAGVFLTQIRRLKPRYTRDQFDLLEKTLDNHSQTTICKALNYCVTHSLYSAVEFKNAAQYFESQIESKISQIYQSGETIVFNSVAAVSKKRELTEYARAAKGGEQ